jgi:hypothetical protein
MSQVRRGVQGCSAALSMSARCRPYTEARRVVKPSVSTQVYSWVKWSMLGLVPVLVQRNTLACV